MCMYIIYWGWIKWNNQAWIPMDLSRPYNRGLIPFDLKSVPKAAESARHIKSGFGEDTVSEPATHEWVAGFCTGDHDLEDRLSSGGPSGHRDECLHQLAGDDLQQSIRQLQNQWGYHLQPWLSPWGHLDQCPSCSGRYFNCWPKHSASAVWRQPFHWWHSGMPDLPHLHCHWRWGLGQHADIQLKRSWGPPGEHRKAKIKPRLHPKKVMLSICWDSKDGLLLELQPTRHENHSTAVLPTIGTSWQSFSTQVLEQRPRLLLFDNQRPHVKAMAHQKLFQMR